ncbi:hypothetical protein DFH11DRAFT_1629570, partial [Phellopilus nigrolimitatus]
MLFGCLLNVLLNHLAPDGLRSLMLHHRCPAFPYSCFIGPLGYYGLAHYFRNDPGSDSSPSFLAYTAILYSTSDIPIVICIRMRPSSIHSFLYIDNALITGISSPYPILPVEPSS